MIGPELVVRASCALLALWGLLNGLQWLTDLRNWRDGGALGWELQRLRRPRILRSRLLGWAYGATGLHIMAFCLLAVSAGLLILPLSGATTPLLLAFLLLVFGLAQRAGADGADKMALVVAAGTLLQCIGLAAGSDRLFLAGTLWSGGQLTLAYFTAGAAKLTLAGWRSGQVPRRVLSSYTYGQGWTAVLTAKPAIALGLAWLIMGVEVLFPLALFAPLPWLCVVLAGFFLFHLAIALAMGLNTYPWAFIAAYPSVLLLAQHLGAR
jgi:hypothetical protein